MNIKYVISLDYKLAMIDITNKLKFNKFNNITFDFSSITVNDDFYKLFNFCIHLIQSKYTKNVTFIINEIKENTVILMLDSIKFSGVLNKFTFVCIGNFNVLKSLEKKYYPDINIEEKI